MATINCTHCAERIKGEAKVCKRCGRRFLEEELTARDKRLHRRNLLPLGIAAAVLAPIATSCDEDSPASVNTGSYSETPSAASEMPTGPQSLDELKAEIGDVWNWTAPASGYPELISKIGRPAFDRSNELIRWGLAVAAVSPRCDKVDYGDVSDRATSDRIVWFVDCRNGERFYIDEDQARSARAQWESGEAAGSSAAQPESARLDGLNETAIVSVCDQRVRTALQLPASYDPAWSRNVRRIPTVGRVEVRREFEAQNAFGVDLPSEYRCLHDGSQIVEVSLRDIAGWEVVYP